MIDSTLYKWFCLLHFSTQIQVHTVSYTMMIIDKWKYEWIKVNKLHMPQGLLLQDRLSQLCQITTLYMCLMGWSTNKTQDKDHEWKPTT